ncbi:MAG: hypothetical protein HUU21_07495 [Polyangiaceae bacterium]|nr:hypothetical protein [Polyangiaceae bacterium]
MMNQPRSRTSEGERRAEPDGALDTLLEEAIELTFTPSYRLNFLKAYCAVLCAKIPLNEPRPTGAPAILWATCWKQDDRAGPSGRGLPIFGLPLGPHAEPFAVDHPEHSVTITFLGDRYDITFRLNGRSDAGAGAIDLAFEHCAERLATLAPELLCYWALHATNELDKSRSASELRLDERRCGLSFRDRSSYVSEQALEGILTTIQEGLAAIEAELAAIEKVPRPESAKDAGSRVITTTTEQRVFLNFRRSYFDYIHLRLRSDSSLSVANVFFVYNPWSLTYRYRAVLPQDLVSDIVGENASALVKQLMRLLASVSTKPLEDEDLEPLRKCGDDGEAIADAVLRDSSLLTHNQVRYAVREFDRERDQERIFTWFLQSIDQPYDTGLIEHLHRSRDLLVIDGPLEPLVDRDKLSAHPRGVRVKLLYQLEKYLLGMGEPEGGKQPPRLWVIMPLLAQQQQRGIWLTRIGSAEARNEEPQEAAVSEGKERLLKSLRTTGRIVAESLATEIDVAFTRQFQGRALRKLEPGEGESIEARLVAMASALPDLFNTVLAGQFGLPLSDKRMEIDWSAGDGASASHTVFFADDATAGPSGLWTGPRYKDCTRKLDGLEVVARLKAFFTCPLGAPEWASSLIERAGKLLQRPTRQPELIGPILAPLTPESLQTLLSLCELQCAGADGDDPWIHRERPRSLALWLLTDADVRRVHCLWLTLETPSLDAFPEGAIEEKIDAIQDIIRASRRRTAEMHAKMANDVIGMINHSLRNTIDYFGSVLTPEKMRVLLHLERLNMDAAAAFLENSVAEPAIWGACGAGGESFPSTLQKALSNPRRTFRVDSDIPPESRVDPRFLGILIELARNAVKSSGEVNDVTLVIRCAKNFPALVDVELETPCTSDDVRMIRDALDITHDKRPQGVRIINLLAGPLLMGNRGRFSWIVRYASDIGTKKDRIVKLQFNTTWTSLEGPASVLEPQAGASQRETKDLLLTARAENIRALEVKS